MDSVLGEILYHNVSGILILKEIESLVQKCTLLPTYVETVFEENYIVMLLLKFRAVHHEKDFYKNVGKLLSTVTLFPKSSLFISQTQLLEVVRTVL